MTKITNISIWLIHFSALVILVLIGFWRLYPYKIITFNTETFPVITKVVKPGGQLIYEADACKHMDIGATVNRVFEDELIYPMVQTISHRTFGCAKQKVVVNIPRTLMPDTYRLKTVFTYEVNPIRVISITRYTDYFVVE